VPWDQQHFEDLLAKWIAATDQPFTTVDGPEFRALLQYTHHPAKKTLKIPHATAVRSHIMELGEEIIDGLKQTFGVGSSPNHALKITHPVLGEHVKFVNILGCMDIE
jgi:hypothetical protein